MTSLNTHPRAGVNTPTSRLFGLDIATAPPADLLRRIIGYAQRGEHRRVSYVNAHVLNQTFTDDALRSALQRADLVYCDGYGVRLATKAIGLPVPHRMTGADWIWGVAALCEAEGRSLYLLGSDAGAAREAAARDTFELFAVARQSNGGIMKFTADLVEFPHPADQLTNRFPPS